MTFLSLACSGATLGLGLDLAGVGQIPDWGDHPAPADLDYIDLVKLVDLDWLATAAIEGGNVITPPPSLSGTIMQRLTPTLTGERPIVGGQVTPWLLLGSPGSSRTL